MFEGRCSCRLVVAVSVLAASSVAAFAGERLRVIAVEAAVRLSPSEASEVVAIVRAGNVLDIHSTVDGWFGVFVPADGTNPRRHGYVPASVVERVAEARAGPGESSPGPPGSSSAPVAFVLDRSQRAVAAVDAVAGESRFARFDSDLNARASRRSPDILLASPDGSRLVVIDAGNGKWSQSAGWRPERQSAIVVLDAATLKTVSRVEGVWGQPFHGFSSDGTRLAVVGPGVGRHGDQDRRSAEMVTLDVRTGAVTGRLALDPLVRPPQRWFDWYSSTALAPDGEHLYLLDRGRPSKDRKKHIDGRITVVSVTSLAALESLPAGAVPKGFAIDPDGDQVFVLSDHAPYARTREERYGELRVLRGARIAATLRVAATPQFVRISPDRQRLVVVSATGLVTVDLPSLYPTGRVDVPRAGITWWTVGDWWGQHGRTISDLVVDPEGRRAFAIHQGSSQLTILDLDKHNRVATLTTGRKASKVGAFMGALMSTMASYYANRAAAQAVGSPVFVYWVYHVLPAHTEIAMRPDGRFVYVANTQSLDVTILDAVTQQIVGHLPNLGYEFEVLRDANLLSIRGPSGLTFLDMTMNREVKDLAVPGVTSRVALSPDKRRLFAASSGRVICLDARTGRFLAAFPEFDDPSDILFLPWPDARPGAPR